MNTKQAVHRPGQWKQSNKPHKYAKGHVFRTEKKAVKVISRKNRDLKRKERRHQATQIRKHKREMVLMKKRGLGAIDSPPFLVAVIPLSQSIDPDDFIKNLQECDDGIVVMQDDQGYCHISSQRLKQRFVFFAPKGNNLHIVMDAMKVADTVLFLHVSESSFADYTELLLSTILAHSCPSTVHTILGLNKLNPKKKTDLKKEVFKRIESRFPDEKIFHSDTRQELQLLLRHVSAQKQRPVGFRDVRPQLIAEKVEFLADSDSASTGSLLVSGYVRHQCLDVNGLVHIPGWGNFQMSKIVYKEDPYLVNMSKRKNVSKDIAEMEELEDIHWTDLVDDKLQQSLVSEVEPDPMSGEQTWPTEEELRQAALENKPEVKKVVEGTSEYQSAWIAESDNDDEENGDDSHDSDDDDTNSMVTAPESLSDEENSAMSDADAEMVQSEETENKDTEGYDNDMNLEEEKKMLVRFREERMEEMFPDEMDTPVDVSARIRYQKFRGLKNFSEAVWNPMENLPFDYGRIYRFENFKQTRKKVMSSELTGAEPGMYVTLHLNEVSRALYDEAKGNHILVVYGLLPHEQKMSVVNVVIRKHPSCKVPIKSKDRLIFHIGFRRFVCEPLFSVHSHGNKFKYLRFLPSNTAIVASFYAPITFQPAPVVVFQQQDNGTHELVATGSLLNVDPNRVIVKRVVLSGHSFKILARTAVVRYMFFNREDIDWFKKIELTTKCGRKGHIKEALGSHGHMKCVFDRQLQSQDVILMALYKRIFPKWTYDINVPTPLSPHDETELI